MNTKRFGKSEGVAARGSAPDRVGRRGRRFLTCLTVILLAGGFSSELRSETPKTADFPELAAAYRLIDGFVSGDTIVSGNDAPATAIDSQRLCNPLPALSPILAYEENAHFLCATGDASQVMSASQQAEGERGRPTFLRRFLFLKPSVFVVDDFVRPAAGDGSFRWLIACRKEPAIAGRQLRISAEDQELVCETLRPAETTPQRTSRAPGTNESGYQVELQQEAGASGVRWLHVFHLRRTGDGPASVESVLEDKDGRFDLAVTTSERVFRLTLPPPGAGAGWIEIQDADGNWLIPRRPLPAGVLPHGPEGVRLIERWDSRYRDGGRPAWDTGVPAAELKRVVENGIVKPCRTVVLGCGSGTNAIYLAGQGFDVTAIDVAPTALGIAAAKAQAAGVQVRWTLADVLAPPDLEPFDFVFDRGCYHNVRYVDAKGFVESLRRLSRPGTRCLVLSLDRDGPPGVRERHMREDFSTLFEFQWLRDSGIEGRGGSAPRPSWSVMLRRKGGN
jgi:SAM-dependent methyltransferase